MDPRVICIISFYDAMRANDIEVLTIPPHTSHLLQLLDSVPFAQFKKSWEGHLMKYNNSHSGQALNKVNFWDVFVPAWNSSICPKNIIAGFKKTGIFLHNPYVIPPEAMAPSIITDTGKNAFCVCICVDVDSSFLCSVWHNNSTS